MLEFIFASILFASWGGTFLALFVLILNKLFESKLSVKLRYILLSLVILRLLFPVMPESSVSVFNYFPHPFALASSLNLHEKENAIPSVIPKNGNVSTLAEQTITHQNSTNENLQSNIIKNSEENQNLFTDFSSSKNLLFKLAALIWLFGALTIFISGLIFCCLFHNIRYKNYAQNDNLCRSISDYCKKIVGVNGNLKIKLAPKLHSPIIVGLFSPTIYLPENLVCKASELELCYIITHELVHWKQKDTIRNMISFFAASIHWFNPIGWIIMRKIKEEREMLCDINVLEILGEEHTASYGSTIIRVANLQSCKPVSRIYQTAFFGGKKQIKRRIMMINRFQSGFAKNFTFAALVLSIALATVTMTNATGTNDLISKQYSNPTSNSKIASAKNNFTLIKSNYQYFDSLERLSRYAGFDYLVPDTLPKEFKVDRFTLNEMNKSANNNNVLTIHYWYSNMDGKMVEGAIEEHFNYMVCKDSLIDYLNKSNTPEKVKNPDRTPKPKKIAGVDGYVLKTYSQLTSYTDDDKKIEGFGQSDYFIWQNNGLWYAVQFTDIDTFDGEKPYTLLNLSEKDIANIVSSLKKPSEITNPGYTSTDKTPSYAVYDKYDLARIKKDWGFQPVLPLELPGLMARSAYMSEVLMANTNFGVFTVNYSLTDVKTISTAVEYSQSNKPIEYNLAVKAYIAQKGKTVKATETPWKLKNINGKNVYYLVDKKNGTHYVWDKGTLDISINKNIDAQALLKTLVK